jgi:transposase
VIASPQPAPGVVDRTRSHGDVLGFGSPDRLAAAAGLAPVPRDSGRISGNLRRPQRNSRRLLRIFYMSAQISIQHDPQSRAYYRRKRDEGKKHHGAVLALARRRVNVLWALLRDGQPYERNATQRSAPTIAAA